MAVGRKTEFIRTNIRIPKAVHRALVRAAREDRRSMNMCILVAVEDWLARRKSQK